MTGQMAQAERLPLWRAAYVIARRDFVAVLFSRAFIFFLLGPLFPLVVGVLAGGVGQQVAAETGNAQIGIAMEAGDADAMIAANDSLRAELGLSLPHMTILRRLQPGEEFDARGAMDERQGNIAAIVTGTLETPTLTATPERLSRWEGPISMIAAQARAQAPTDYPEVTLNEVATSGAQERNTRIRTAQSGMALLFLLIMLLAGMVLSNLVEEKANKIIEILAAAIPMDAVFMGKLFAMLAVSLVGIAVWGSVIGGLIMLAGSQGQLGAQLQGMAAPGVGWPLFFLFSAIYFAMGYLLLGSIFLTIGSMAATVREVQTLSMPATMMQLLVFFFANFALTRQGEPLELAAVAFPLSSPYAMLARAATDDALWPHALALIWQAAAVALFVKVGASLFRKRVMKSGPQKVKGRGFLRGLLPGSRRRETSKA